MTIDEFLAIPEEKPYREFLRGEVVEKPMPTELHGATVMELGRRLGNYLRETGLGRVVTEVRHAARSADWVYLPDLNVRIFKAGAPRAAQGRGAVETAPDFAIEVLSPEDRVSRWLERVQLYLEAGTRLLWVIDPEDQTVLVYRPGQPARTFRSGETLRADPVLPEFTLDAAEFFAAARGEEPPEDDHA
jgi:Uma2 family endonuclease